ncbi:MAG: MSMEG_0567/Sll0786 family nitrogen starvation N-acetyltransferase [Bacteroidota bacterium]
MIIETPPAYKCNYLSFEFARENWQQAGYWDLRKRIFCNEQQIFEQHDRDEIDQRAIPIVAECSYGGQPDEVVGVVRIDQRAPGVWWGSRLGVSIPYRQLSRFHTLGLFSDNVPVHPFTLNVGGSLIYKAVSTAMGIGCTEFYAYVQEQNVNFFKRMHWVTLDTKVYHGKMHHLMQCDLSSYQASDRTMLRLLFGAAA